MRKAIEVALVDGGLRPQSGRILLGLSGGPDSRVLLDALAALRERLTLKIDVCIVDHGLRAGSHKEAQAALEVSQRLGVPGIVQRVIIDDKTPRGARDARYVALARAAVACKADAIALAHTASDQAETLIDHLLRGSGSRGLGAMAPRRMLGSLTEAKVATDHLALIRPMLEVARAEVEVYVDEAGLAVVRDPTNDDLRYRRSRIRHRVMPLLREERADLDRALVRLCERLRLDAEYLDAEAKRCRAVLTTTTMLDLPGVQQLHPAIQARILREMCEDVGIPGDRVPLDALLRLCRGRHGTSQIDLPLGKIAERRYARLRIGDPQLVVPVPDEINVTVAGTYELGTLLVRVPKKLMSTSAGAGALVFRRPRTGDRLGSRKLSDILVDKKVARPDRSRLWALAEADGAPGRAIVQWVALPQDLSNDTGTGALAWEWPPSGLRPRVVPTPPRATPKATKKPSR